MILVFLSVLIIVYYITMIEMHYYPRVKPTCYNIIYSSGQTTSSWTTCGEKYKLVSIANY